MAKTNTTPTDTEAATTLQSSGNAVALDVQSSPAPQPPPEQEPRARVRVLKHRAEFLGFIFAKDYRLDIPVTEARRLVSLGIVEIIG